ncbi:CPBP family glutamic-type intramembrane protease, partial [Streptococcus sobrinus]
MSFSGESGRNQIIEEYILRGFVRYYFSPKIEKTDQFVLYRLASSNLFSVVHTPENFLQFLVYFTMELSFAWIYMMKRDLRYSIAL